MTFFWWAGGGVRSGAPGSLCSAWSYPPPPPPPTPPPPPRGGLDLPKSSKIHCCAYPLRGGQDLVPKAALLFLNFSSFVSALAPFLNSNSWNLLLRPPGRSPGLKPYFFKKGLCTQEASQGAGQRTKESTLSRAKEVRMRVTFHKVGSVRKRLKSGSSHCNKPNQHPRGCVFDSRPPSVGEESSIVVSCGVGRMCGPDPVSLWLCRPAAVAPTQRLAWEPPYAMSTALKKKR